MSLFRTTAIAAALIGGTTAGANAAIVYATDAEIVVDGPRGTGGGRANISNALGSSLGDFFELGYGATVDFVFGRNFTGPGNTVEVTFSSPPPFVESVTVQAGRGGAFTTVASLTNDGAGAPGGVSFDFDGNFDTLRLIDTSPRTRATGGFDVDRISVSTIPVPAAGAGLLAGLGALTLLRRRKA